MAIGWLYGIVVALGTLALLNCSQVKGNHKGYTIQFPDDSEDDWTDIPGVPGIDYPTYKKVPKKTNFTCSNYEFGQGFYADIETHCQVYHVCHPNGMNSFLCPVGTMFDQRILTCDFWYNVDCQNSGDFYPGTSPKDHHPEESKPTNVQKGDAGDGYPFEGLHQIDEDQYTKGKSEYVHPTPQSPKVTGPVKGEAFSHERPVEPTTTKHQSTIRPSEIPPTKEYDFPSRGVYTKGVYSTSTTEVSPVPPTEVPKSESKVLVSVEKVPSKPVAPPKSGYIGFKKVSVAATKPLFSLSSIKVPPKLLHLPRPVVKAQKPIVPSAAVLDSLKPTIKIAFANFLAKVHMTKQQSLENLWRTFLHYYLRPHLKSGLYLPVYPAPRPVYKGPAYFNRPVAFKGHHLVKGHP